MSMYSLAVGDGHQHDRGAVLLAALGNPDPGRFRDAWVEKGEDDQPVIAIYTRNGGGNREDYEDIIDGLQSHPLYLRDADDDFDSTYATFYFSTPDELVEAFRAVAQEPVDTDRRWMDAIAALSGTTGEAS
ncbi:hypothetical protein ACIP8U_00690 [Streptomyces pseudovenezuelae]|uniref:hypothetical protein n=1 Tax=Streptomyces pseudovenezuelae TaxID=67350 RepID=UPI003815BC8F